ncbi:hypothetical protein D3C76_1296700 [compost metagenome]
MSCTILSMSMSMPITTTITGIPMSMCTITIMTTTITAMHITSICIIMMFPMSTTIMENMPMAGIATPIAMIITMKRQAAMKLLPIFTGKS